MPNFEIYIFERLVGPHRYSTLAYDMVLLSAVYGTLLQALARFGPAGSLIYTEFGRTQRRQER